MSENKDQAKYSSEETAPSGSTPEQLSPSETISSEEIEHSSQSNNPSKDDEQQENEKNMEEEQSGLSTTVKILIGVGVVIGGLIVCGIVAFILSVTLLAVNPAANFESTRNTQRSSDISAILNAVIQYTSESGNSLETLLTDAGFNGRIATCSPEFPSTLYTPISSGSNSIDSYIDLDRALVPDYIVFIPVDPKITTVPGGEDVYSGYAICQTEDGRIQVLATETESSTENLYVVR